MNEFESKEVKATIPEPIKRDRDNMRIAMICSSAIICVCLISIGIVGVQIFKNKSYEKQQRIDISNEQRRLDEIEEKENTRKISLNYCLLDAEDVYWEYVRLNGTLTDEEKGTYRALQSVWNEAQDRKDAKSDICFKKYSK